MFQNVLRRLAKDTNFIRRSLKHARIPKGPAPASVQIRCFTDVKDEVLQPFDTSVLEFLVCPLSKKPLRYEEESNELINDELGIAYPITNGIPNMIPQDARIIQKNPDTTPGIDTNK